MIEKASRWYVQISNEKGSLRKTALAQGESRGSLVPLWPAKSPDLINYIAYEDDRKMTVKLSICDVQGRNNFQLFPNRH